MLTSIFEESLTLYVSVDHWNLKDWLTKSQPVGRTGAGLPYKGAWQDMTGSLFCGKHFTYCILMEGYIFNKLDEHLFHMSYL